jgi:hypothetical protein
MEENDECRWGRKDGDAHIGGCQDSGSRTSPQKITRVIFEAARLIPAVPTQNQIENSFCVVKMSNKRAQICRMPK